MAVVGLVRVRDILTEDQQQMKRVVMNTIIEILVPSDDGSYLRWVDISKAVRRVRPDMTVGSVAKVELEIFGCGTEIDALEVKAEAIEGMRLFVSQWDEAMASTLPEDGDRCRFCRVPAHTTMQIGGECVNRVACAARMGPF